MKTGLLVLHGFTGGPFEVRPFIDYVRGLTDWRIVVPTLPGHGFPPNLRGISAEAWMMEAETAFRKLRKEVDRVIVAGFSMGGLIAMHLCMRYEVDRLVLMSAAVKYVSPRILLGDLLSLAKESVTRHYKTTTFRHLYNYKLTHTPIRSTFEFIRLHKMVLPHLNLVRTPAIIVQGKRDEIVHFSAGRQIYEGIASAEKRLLFSENGKHHICFSDDRKKWFSDVLMFMKGE